MNRQRKSTSIIAVFCLVIALLAVLFSFPTSSYAAHILVTTLDDEVLFDGDCSLREAIHAANANTAVDACTPGSPGMDTITFSTSGNITLTSALPLITDDLSIIGPGESELTIDGNNAVNILTTDTGHTLNLEAMTLANGSAGIGAALWNKAGSTVSLSRTTLSNNTSGLDGGAIYNEGTMVITESTLRDNAADFFGGAILNSPGASLTIIDSTISGSRLTNTSFFSLAGGGIFNRGTLNISGSTFTDNGTGCFICNGGAIESRDGSLMITNSTFADNYGTGGAAILVGSGTAFITNSTFVDNFGKIFGAIVHYSGPFTIRNSILYNSEFGGNLGIFDGGHNLEYPRITFFSTSINADPLLGPLQDNGGPTHTFALSSDSPAIDAVPLASCTLATDQRGATRPQGSACDIGSFEKILNLPPTADAGGPYQVNEGSSIEVTGNGTDPDGDMLTFAWDLNNDGLYENTSQNATFSAADLDGPDTRTIILKVTDSGNLTATDSAVVDVLNVAPTADFTAIPTTIITGLAANLEFTNPFDPSPADTAAGFEYAYDCENDGVYELAGSPQTTYPCIYDNEGAITARSRIQDKDGGFTDYTAQLTIKSPQTALEDLINDIDDLIAEGIINQGQGQGLKAKLEAAINQFNRGHLDTALNLLNAFVNLVQADIQSGVLPEAEGQALLDTANQIIRAISAS